MLSQVEMKRRPKVPFISTFKFAVHHTNRNPKALSGKSNSQQWTKTLNRPERIYALPATFRCLMCPFHASNPNASAAALAALCTFSSFYRCSRSVLTSTTEESITDNRVNGPYLAAVEVVTRFLSHKRHLQMRVRVDATCKNTLKAPQVVTKHPGRIQVHIICTKHNFARTIGFSSSRLRS
jgi:hypothetical protein